ncbi:spindle pole body protein Ppc89 [Sugiyamaella lignohabitans]|uniref:Spindle pole body protein Ppc89 n=1 Tax=Sugiyamaella lignohabitans TaxID=796027 RepID=A0A167CDE5_9ASCO|nr:spindle pole body protein Ppc89 [Sugiyamaella lignohabitans]ANB11545.1 spindle pole body protein Ppc89 [Sugiyamaella lignohabitans]
MTSELEFTDFSILQGPGMDPDQQHTPRIAKARAQVGGISDGEFGNRAKTTRFSRPAAGLNNSFLSPRIGDAELNQFNGFSYRIDNDKDEADILDDSDFMNSIELGRGRKPEFNLSNLSHRGQDIDPVQSRRRQNQNQNRNLGRGDSGIDGFGDESSSHQSLDKVTDRKKSPLDAKNPKPSAVPLSPMKDFTVPTEYKDDHSFMAQLGLDEFANGKKSAKSVATPVSARRQSKKTRQVSSSAATSGSERLAARLPDISGLSSIFSSDEQLSSRRNKKSSSIDNSHKTVVSVPLDDDDKALFSAFSSFQTKIDKLQKDKVNLKEIINTQEREMSQFRDEYAKLNEHSESVELKAKKLKAVSLALREKLQTERAERQQLKQQQPSYQAIIERDSALQMLSQRDQEISRLQMENLSLKKELEQLRASSIASGSDKVTPPTPPAEPEVKLDQSLPTQIQLQQSTNGVSSSDNELNTLINKLCNLLTLHLEGNKPQDIQQTQLPQSQEQQISTSEDSQTSTSDSQAKDSLGTELEILTRVAEAINRLIVLKEQKLDQPAIPDINSSRQPRTVIANAGTNTTPSSLLNPLTTSNTPQDKHNSKTATTNAPSSNNATYKPVPTRLIDRCMQCTDSSDEETHEPLEKSNKTRRRHQSNTRQTSDSDSAWDEEPTARPSMPADEAVKLILDKMSDELTTLKNNYIQVCQEYDNADPAVEKRRRQELADRLIKSVKEVEAKSDLIYAMNDIVVAANIQLDASDNDDDFEAKLGARIGKGQWIVS